MTEIGKLIETLNSAIQKAGGEAARVWPDMVAAEKLSYAAGLFGFGALSVLLFGLSVLFTVFATANDDDDLFGPVVFAFLAAVFFGVLGGTSLTGYFYPEAALVRELIGK